METVIPEIVDAPQFNSQEEKLYYLIKSWKKDYWSFITTCIRTKDEKDIVTPVKKFPDDPYLKEVLDTVHSSEILLLPKSRQMMISWVICAYALWRALFYPYQLILIQSKREEDAANFVSNGDIQSARISFMYEKLPPFVKTGDRALSRASFSIFELSNGSKIWGIPEGADIIRGNVPSMLLSDEMAFQPQAEAAYQAALPLAKNGGKFVGVSTALPGFFWELRDPKGTDIHKVRQGLRKWTTPSQVNVLEVHYTADLKRDEAWKDRELVGYPGGETGYEWQREMEISAESTGGDLAYPIMRSHRENVVVQPFDVSNMRLYGGLDYGNRNPTSFHVYAVDTNGKIYSCYEIYETYLGYIGLVEAIKACPYYDHIEYIAADPSMWAMTQDTRDGLKSIAELMMELEPIPLERGSRGAAELACDILLANHWKNLEDPQFQIFKSCPQQIYEFQKLRWEDFAAAVQRRKNLKEMLVDKDNHSHDDFAYFFTKWFVPQDPITEQSVVLELEEEYEMEEHLGDITGYPDY